MDMDEMMNESEAEAGDLTTMAVPGTGIEKLLDSITELRKRQDELVAAEKLIAGEIKELERLAVEQLQTLGLKGCKTATRTWTLSEYISITVPKANRDAVLAVAEQIRDEDGNSMADEIRTVTTQTLRSWLLEQRKNRENVDMNEPVAKGTAFDGLVSEFRTVRLGSCKRGR